MMRPVMYQAKKMNQVINALKTSFRLSMSVIICLSTMVALGVAGESQKPTISKLVVRDVNVFLISAHGKKLNDANLFRSTTPGYMSSRRLSADAEQSEKPAPLGMLTFEGPEVKDIDILVEFPSGRFLSHWPTARIQSRRIYWRSQNLLKSSAPSHILPESHWLHPLQSADRLYVKGVDKCERFLLYDVEIPHTPRISMTHSGEGFQLKNGESFALHDVTVLEPTKNSDLWKVAGIDSVPGVKTETPKAKSGSDEKKKPEAVDPLSEAALKAKEAVNKAEQLKLLGNQLKNVGVLPQLSASSAKTQQKEAPAAKSAQMKPVHLPYLESQPVSRDKILEYWENKLTERGLGKPETEHLLRILGQVGFREDQATVVFCLDESYLDKIVPLEITPYPDVLKRTALVILLDADPALLKRIDALIEQLGDPVWARREAAQKQLEEYGRAAQQQLKTATKNKDLEIVYRAEQILDKIK